jgi:peptide/nickel transport system substrate-binding protein
MLARQSSISWTPTDGEPMGLYRILIWCLTISLAVFGTASPSAAADLTVGIGADVTAIDPHYHNVTPNNNVAAHIFDYLVLRDERQKPIPGLAESWRTVDPLTWEFKLRRGVKFHDGSDFTAADVVVDRVFRRCPTARRHSPHTPSRLGNDRCRSFTIRFRTATLHPLMPTDMTQVAIVSKSA